MRFRPIRGSKRGQGGLTAIAAAKLPWHDGKVFGRAGEIPRSHGAASHPRDGIERRRAEAGNPTHAPLHPGDPTHVRQHRAQHGASGTPSRPVPDRDLDGAGCLAAGDMGALARTGRAPRAHGLAQPGREARAAAVSMATTKESVEQLPAKIARYQSPLGEQNTKARSSSRCCAASVGTSRMSTRSTASTSSARWITRSTMR
jgi:hypothetical protein